MSSPTHSDLSQNNVEMLKEQCREMQQQHEEQQQSLLRLQEAVEARRVECAAQKARREAEAKAKEEAERQRVVEEEERKKRTVEYLQQLWDKVLEKEAVLLEGAKDPRSWGPSEKRLPPEMRRCNGPPRRLGGSNWGSTARVPQSRWGVLPPARGVCVLGRIAWCTPQGE